MCGTWPHTSTTKQSNNVKKHQLLPSWVMPVRPGVEPPFCKHRCWTMLLTATWFTATGELIYCYTHTHINATYTYNWHHFVTCLLWSMSLESCEKFSLPLQLSKLQWKWKLFATFGTHRLQRNQRSYLLLFVRQVTFLNSWPYRCFPTPVLYSTGVGKHR